MRKPTLLLSVLVLMGSQLSANTFIFSTPSGAMEGGLNVDVSANLDIVSSTTLIVTLSNLETNPTADDQALSFFTFDIGANLGSVFTFTSSAEQLTITGNNPADYSTTTAQPTQWNMSATGTNHNLIGLCDIDAGPCAGKGAQWPKLALLGGPDGSNAYANANQSIQNGAHTPLLFETATFTFTTTGLNPTATALNTITNAEFGFGTTGNENISSNIKETEVSNAPEPGPAALLFAGITFLAFVRRRSAR